MISAARTLLTTDADNLPRSKHDGMPVILPREGYGAWLDPKIETMDKLGRLLVPYSGSEMTSYPVSTRVNGPKDEGEGLVEPESDIGV